MGIVREFLDLIDFLQKRGGRPWKRKTIVVAIAILFVAGIIGMVSTWIFKEWIGNFRIQRLEVQIDEIKKALERQQRREVWSNKELQNTALDLVGKIHSKIATAVERSPIQYAHPTHVALRLGPFSAAEFLLLERYKVQARVLRDEILLRLPSSKREESATALYDEEVHIETMRGIARDLERLARLLPGEGA